MEARQWNRMIWMVNNNIPRSEAEKEFSEEEMKTYDKLVSDLAELRKKHPEAAYSPVESDW